MKNKYLRDFSVFKIDIFECQQPIKRYIKQNFMSNAVKEKREFLGSNVKLKKSLFRCNFQITHHVFPRGKMSQSFAESLF